MNRADIIAKAKRDYPEHGYTTVQWNTEYRLAELDVAQKTACIEDDYTWDEDNNSFVDDVSSLTLPSNFLVPDDVGGLLYYDGSNWTKLEFKTMEWLDAEQGGWRTASASAPDYWYIRQGSLYFTPGIEDVSDKQLKLYYGAIPDDGGTAVPFNTIARYEPFHDTIVMALGLAVKKSRGKITGAKPDWGPLKGEYAARCREFKAFVKGSMHKGDYPDLQNMGAGYK